MTPKITATGDISMDIDCDPIVAGRNQTRATQKGLIAAFERVTNSAKACTEAKPGETLLIGGLRQKETQGGDVQITILEWSAGHWLVVSFQPSAPRLKRN